MEDKPEVERVGALYNFTLATYKHIFKTVRVHTIKCLAVN